jgi:hypothetical protein
VNIHPDIKYDGDMDRKGVIDDLVEKEYLYDKYNGRVSVPRGGGWESLFVWSTSAAHFTNQTWDVRASIAIESLGPFNRHIVRSYQCTMDAPKVEWVLRQMDAHTTISQWYDVSSKHLGDNGLGAIPSQLESSLEAIVMLGYGRNDSAVRANAMAIGDHTQGCVITHTKIPWALFTVLVLTTLGTLLMFAYWLFSSIHLRRLQSRSSLAPYARSINERTPNGLLGWMIQAVSEHTRDLTDDAVTAKDIALWNLGLGEKGSLTIRPAGSAAGQTPNQRVGKPHKMPSSGRGAQVPELYRPDGKVESAVQ